MNAQKIPEEAQSAKELKTSSPTQDLLRFKVWWTTNPWAWLMNLVVGSLVGAITAGLYFRDRVDEKARSAVLDERFLSVLAAKVRPTCIFSTREAIEFDSGIGEFVSGIKVVSIPAQEGYQVEIGGKRHLAHAPLLTCIDGNLHVSKIERGRRHDWVVQVVPNPKGEMFFGRENTNAVYRFKLELLY